MHSLHVDTARTWRGGQNQALLTVLGLRSSGHRTLLVCHPEGELRRRAAEGGDLIPLAPRSEMDFAAAWRLCRIVRQEQPDVVHAHDPHGIALVSLALAMGRLPKVPVFVASRRVDFPLGRNAFSRWKHRQVDAFLCASEAIRQLVISQGIEPQRAVTVHEGIDLEHVDAAPAVDARGAFWLPHDVPLVGQVGALVPHKGQRYLIEAAARVVVRVPDARFVILGEGELRPTLEQAVKKTGLERHVLLPGFRQDVLSLMKGFDIFVMCSVMEGLGTSVLDAMACHKPVVGTTAGGIPEMIVDDATGLLVRPRDGEALAAAILKLIDQPDVRTRMGLAGRQRVEEHFSADRMLERTVAVYERLRGRQNPESGQGPAGDSGRP
ncbi:MAG: glycosyltransferase [Vicinamibacterales bacterium]